MILTISLDETASAQLAREAAARQLAPEEVARDFIGRALARLAEEESWREVNRRRGELIQKSRVSGLTPEESHELDRLQGMGEPGALATGVVALSS
jgi:hypothetical protein